MRTNNKKRKLTIGCLLFGFLGSFAIVAEPASANAANMRYPGMLCQSYNDELDVKKEAYFKNNSGSTIDVMCPLMKLPGMGSPRTINLQGNMKNAKAKACHTPVGSTGKGCTNYVFENGGLITISNLSFNTNFAWHVQLRLPGGKYLSRVEALD